LRTRLTPAAPAREQTEAASALVHTKRLRPTEEAVDLDSPAGRHPLLDAGQDEKFETPTDLIAAARRAAARKPEEEASASHTKSADAGLSQPSIAPGRPLMQNRSLLIVAAAILLAISAALLYQRLQSKPEPVILPPVIEQSAPAPEAPPAQSDSWAPVPQPQNDPNKNAANDGEGGNFTEVTKSSYGSAPPETENAVEPGALGQGEVSLPPGIVFSVEDPSSPAATPAEAAPSPSADPADTPEATNPALIARAQELLNKLGYNVGLVDGEMNARTRRAIASFERNNGLQETGKVTIQLVTVLERVAS